MRDRDVWRHARDGVAIQHTQAREQAASQRKLDELLRAIPGAEERLMMLEEAPDDVLHGVVEDQRSQQDDAAAREPAPDGGGRPTAPR